MHIYTIYIHIHTYSYIYTYMYIISYAFNIHMYKIYIRQANCWLRPMGGRYLTGVPSWPGGRGRGAGQGWAHSLRSPAHVASMLIIRIEIYKLYVCIQYLYIFKIHIYRYF